MIPLDFWGGVILMTLSLPVFWWLFYHAFGPSETLKSRLSVIASILIYAALIWVIWIPAKSKVHGTLIYDVADFGDNDDVYGIQWKKRYARIILDLKNIGDHDLTNIDAYLWVDAQIVATGMAKGINTCTWENYPNAPGAASLQVTNIEGRSEIHLAQDKWSSQMLHIRCERLSANFSQIEMVFAITPKISSEMMVPGGHLNMGKAHPGWAKVWISLMANYRPVSWTISQCFVREQCGSIPDLPLGQKPSFLFLLSRTARAGASALGF